MTAALHNDVVNCSFGPAAGGAGCAPAPASKKVALARRAQPSGTGGDPLVDVKKFVC